LGNLLGNPFFNFGVTHLKGNIMAIKLSDYNPIPKSSNIKIHKENNRKFLFRLKLKTWDIKKGAYAYKQYSKVFTVKATNHSRKDNINTAKAEFIKFKEESENRANGNSSKNITLDELFIKYMETQPVSKWTHKKAHIYDLYIGNSQLSNVTNKPTEEQRAKREAYNQYKIGHILIQNIIPHQIELIISKMKTEHGLSDRTQKGIIEVLNPVFKFALQNRFITESPTEYIKVKIGSQKKVVTNAGELFIKVYKGIHEYYNDYPFYRALFLFGFTGRRKSEILNMKWENIDFDNNYYWIEETKNNQTQLFSLPEFIKEPLLEMESDRVGYVFESPTHRGKALSDISRQMNNLKKFIGVSDLTLHYMRNILVSALAEQGTEGITLSGILGHKDINTINKYLSNSTMKSSIKGLETIDKILDAEIIE